MRAHIVSLVIGGVSATVASVAGACLPDTVCEDHASLFIPPSGSTIPANARGLSWDPIASTSFPDSGNSFGVVGERGEPIARRDDTERGTSEFLFRTCLRPNTNYTLDYAVQCRREQPSTGFIRFRTGPEAPLPTALGSLSVSAPQRSFSTVYSGGSHDTCRTPIPMEVIRIDWTPSAEAAPWAAAFRYDVFVDGVPWRWHRRDSERRETRLPVSVFAHCGDADGGVYNWGPRLSSGTHTVAIRYSLPGFAETWSLSTPVRFTCGDAPAGDAGVDSGVTLDDAGLPMHDNGTAPPDAFTPRVCTPPEERGCSVSPRTVPRRAWMMTALVGLARVRRRTRRAQR